MPTFCTFTQIIKTLLVPTLEITAIGAVAAISTSCGSEKKDLIHVTDVRLNKHSTTLFIDDTETLIQLYYLNMQLISQLLKLQATQMCYCR